MNLSKTRIFSLAEDSLIKAVLTSASLCDSSLNEVAMTLIMGEDAIAVQHQNGSVFENLPPERFLALGMQIALQRYREIGANVVAPGLYTVVGFLPLSNLPVPIESPEFTDFWAFVVQSVGQTICWDGRGGQIVVEVIGDDGDSIRGFTLECRTVGSRI